VDVYKRKLKELKDVIEPVFFRLEEHRGRPQLVNDSATFIAQAKAIVSKWNTTHPQVSTNTEEERERRVGTAIERPQHAADPHNVGARGSVVKTRNPHRGAPHRSAHTQRHTHTFGGGDTQPGFLCARGRATRLGRRTAALRQAASRVYGSDTACAGLSQ
jgi:hypothetical protein